MKKFIFLIAIAVIAIITLSATDVRSARLISKLDIMENLITPTTSTFIEINGLDEAVNYQNGSLRSDADHVWAKTVTGTGTIDLTVLTNTLGETLNLTGDVVVAAKFLLQDISGATCTISQGATLAYPLLGTTFSFQLNANQSLLFKADTVIIPISASAKNIHYKISDETTKLYIMLLSANSYH